MVDAATIVGDALEKLMSGEKEFDAVKYMGQHRMAFAELNNMYMTGKDIDSVIKRVSYTVSGGNQYCHGKKLGVTAYIG